MEDRTPQLRIGELATRTGVSAERLRAWEARYGLLEPSRSGGNFRLYSREDERRVRLMQRHLAQGIAAAEAAELARNGIVKPTPARLGWTIPPRVRDRSLFLMRRALTDFDEGSAEQALDDLFRAFTIEAVIRDAILPFLREVGEAWLGGRATPAQEHFASTIVLGRLMGLARGWGTGRGPRAMLACPSGERHTLGLIAFGIALARRGWRITYLGEDVPVGAIAQAASQTRPDLIVLAGCQVRYFAEAAGPLRDLAARRRVALAGAGASAALARRVGAEHIAADPVTAAEQLTHPARAGG